VYTLDAVSIGGGEMPQIFKALASISVWFLFVLGWLVVLIALIMGIISGRLFAPAAGPPPIQTFIAVAVAVASITLSVVVMKLRQMLE